VVGGCEDEGDGNTMTAGVAVVYHPGSGGSGGQCRVGTLTLWMTFFPLSTNPVAGKDVHFAGLMLYIYLL